jgi:dihydroxyacid dehydratase/phosphogluconate dehydratase
VIAIVNTWSDANQCHTHFKQRVEDVKRGILQAGGWPMELPAISLSESLVKPTSMLYRNFLAMETEELLRSHPVDGAVLMGGCDKTTPGLLMGALSMGLPCIYLPAGPMLRGNWRGQVLGSGSDAFKYWDERRAGRLSDQAWAEMEAGIARSHGTCMTMGTAATMMGIAEALGFTLPGASSIPRTPTMCACRPSAAGASCRWCGMTDTRADAVTWQLRQRDCRGHGHGLQHQRHHPPGGHQPPRRAGGHAGRFRCGQPPVGVIANIRPAAAT